MGACTFHDTAIVRQGSIQDAYQTAVENALYEHGHNPYNSTISTTNGVVDRTDVWKKSGQSVQDFINQDIDKAEKWGPAFAIKDDGSNTVHFYGRAAE